MDTKDAMNENTKCNNSQVKYMTEGRHFFISLFRHLKELITKAIWPGPQRHLYGFFINIPLSDS